MMKLDHIAIAVRSLSDSLKFYKDALGLELGGTETVEEEGVHVALLPVGGPRIELLEPISEDTAVGRFISKRGEGLHHISYEVEDLEAKIEAMKAQGVRFLDGYPRRGAEGKLVAFLHPSSANGVLVELSETVKEQ
jgi:methylmalonyl-CoA/ethylmalonyl-CoA epimerase